MFNIFFSICISIYWFKHCNVSRSTSFMKAFCRLVPHQPVNYFFALNDYDAITNVIPVSARKFACMSFHIGGFLLNGIVIRPPVTSWCIFLVLLIIYFISSASLVLYSIIITLTGKERAGLYIVVYQWACTLVCAHFCVCPFGSLPTVICESQCLHFIVIIIVLCQIRI